MDPQLRHPANAAAAAFATPAPQAHDDGAVHGSKGAPGLSLGARDFQQLDIAIAMPMAASSDSDSDYIAAPRSILRSRGSRPVDRTSSRISSVFGCNRRLPAAACCIARRPGKRVTFRASVEVTEYSKTFGHDRVPGDGSYLSVGLGKATWSGLLPLAPHHHGKRPDTLSYLPEEKRAGMLRASMGHDRFNEAVACHRRETAEVIRLRKEALEDSKDPPDLMPVSYQEARERALKVAAEARDAASSLGFDSLAASVALSNCAIHSTLVSPSLVIPTPVAESTGWSACLKRKHTPTSTDGGAPVASKVVCLKADARHEIDEEGCIEMQDGHLEAKLFNEASHPLR